eukprot:364319-Chlamydomonas_euryale.AAC.11
MHGDRNVCDKRLHCDVCTVCVCTVLKCSAVVGADISGSVDHSRDCARSAYAATHAGASAPLFFITAAAAASAVVRCITADTPKQKPHGRRGCARCFSRRHAARVVPRHVMRHQQRAHATVRGAPRRCGHPEAGAAIIAILQLVLAPLMQRRLSLQVSMWLLRRRRLQQHDWRASRCGCCCSAAAFVLAALRSCAAYLATLAAAAAAAVAVNVAAAAAWFRRQRHHCRRHCRRGARRVGLQRWLRPRVPRRHRAHQHQKRRARPPRVVCIGEAIGEARAEVQQRDCGAARHARKAVGGAGCHILTAQAFAGGARRGREYEGLDETGRDSVGQEGVVRDGMGWDGIGWVKPKVPQPHLMQAEHWLDGSAAIVAAIVCASAVRSTRISKRWSAELAAGACQLRLSAHGARAPHGVELVQCRHKVHLRGARVGKAHIDAGARRVRQRTQQGGRAAARPGRFGAARHPRKQPSRGCLWRGGEDVGRGCRGKCCPRRIHKMTSGGRRTEKGGRRR